MHSERKMVTKYRQKEKGNEMSVYLQPGQLRSLTLRGIQCIHALERVSLERKGAGVFCSVNSELCVLLERCFALIALMGVRLCMRLYVLTQTL